MTWVPEATGVAVVVAILAVTIGFVRHDPVKTIILNAIGYPLFLVGLGVAAEVSMQAFWAAGAASLGALLFTMADHNRRTARAAAAGTLPPS